ncbi:MAG: SIS domain-containing protein [Mycobacteriales bacterium]
MIGDGFEVDEYLLDDPDAIAGRDPGDALLAVSSAPAQLREALFTAGEIDFSELAAEGRPRSIVVAGMGAAGRAGDLLAAVLGNTCPVPVLTHRGYGLPGWVGPADLVVPVSYSGTTQETISAADEAIRRGCRLFTVAAAGSLLAVRTEGRGPVAALTRSSRRSATSIWSLSMPLVVLAGKLGLTGGGDAAVGDTPEILELMTERYKPSRDTFLNPAKTLAVSLAGRLPIIWGVSAATGVAADRFASQLAVIAQYPAICGTLPEAGHQESAGPDRREHGGLPVHFVLFRDTEEHPQVARRADAARDVREEMGSTVIEIKAEGSTPLARIASLAALGDFSAVYVAMLLGVDPSGPRMAGALPIRRSDLE